MTMLMRVCRRQMASAHTAVAASLVPLHVAAYRKSFTAACVRALEWLFASVAVGVYLQARRSAESFAACRTNVSIL